MYKRQGIFDAHLETVFPNISFHWLLEGKTEAPETVVWNHRTYRVFGGVSHPEGGQSALATTYWMDVTDTEEMRRTLELTLSLIHILSSSISCWAFSCSEISLAVTAPKSLPPAPPLALSLIHI